MNQQIDQDRHWMQRALELARRGIALTSPNPAVGCVILDRNGQVAGEGWHEYDRMDHAEVAAIENAQQRAPASSTQSSLRGGTAYVTLEPCNHTGRTGPCTQALIAAGVARVVAATIDPNPSVAGHGLDKLRSAGVETTVGVCETEARRLNEGFAHWSQHQRPLVLMKVAMTIDGRIAPPPGEHLLREPFWITSEASRAAVQPLRWQADAVLTGVDTVLADDPLLTDRTGLGRRRPLLRVILDSALRMPLDSKLVVTAHNDVAVFTVSRDEARIREFRARGVRVEVLHDETGVPSDRSSSLGWKAGVPSDRSSSLGWKAGVPSDRSSSLGWKAGVPSDKTSPLGCVVGRVPLGKVLDMLGAEGILTLLTETGTRLNTALLAAGLVDRIHLFISPQIMGSDAVPAFRGMPHALRLNEVEIERYGDDLGLSSLLRDPWPPKPQEPKEDNPQADPVLLP
jgi:diaminohydroxyphosphoribosylaminopyrimidine deaminase/5-amino-6-(5-phosphoribosylamino)uracil reductase